MKIIIFDENFHVTSQAVENYLKSIYTLSIVENDKVSTNSIADRLNTKASSVTDMLKKLSVKGLAEYKKYRGVCLTDKGEALAIEVIRKHRLWEVFLVDKLNFGWEEVHEIAEQLEHVSSPLLVDRLDAFLGHPERDPHGDPIPDAQGKLKLDPAVLKLSFCEKGDRGVVVGVEDLGAAFLNYLKSSGLVLGVIVKVIGRFDFDHSWEVNVGDSSLNVSAKVAENLWIKRMAP